MATDAVNPPSGREAPPPKPRRFYKDVGVADEDGIWCVTLDTKPVRTPMRKLLGSPRKSLAEAIAKEWDDQDPDIDREAMPITRLVSTAMDRIAPEREAVIESLMTYVEADLLCYRATYPATLKAKQHEAWQPVLDWLHKDFGAQFTVVDGVMPAQQSKGTADALRAAIEALSDERLTAFQACAAATKSLALSMALVHGQLKPADVCAYAHLDETFQAEQWGEDREALARRRAIDAEILAIGQYLALLK